MKKMDERSRALASENFHFALYLAHKYLWTGFELDELKSMCSFALCKAATSFDESKGSKFATYVTRVTHNEILMAHRVNKTRKLEKCLGRTLSLSKPIEAKDENRVIEDRVGKVDYSYDVIDAINSIDKNNRQIKARVLYHFYGYSQKEIGHKLGVDRSGISRILKEPIEKGSVVV